MDLLAEKNDETSSIRKQNQDHADPHKYDFDFPMSIVHDPKRDVESQEAPLAKNTDNTVRNAPEWMNANQHKNI